MKLKRLIRSLHWRVMRIFCGMKYWPGRAAMDAGHAVGEIGCPACGCVVHGALHDPYCHWCGKPFFDNA